jgi:hypothetical protein
VIVICAVFGCLISAIGCFYGMKILNSRKRTLIKMNNEIQFKGVNNYQKHPLKSDGNKSSDAEKLDNESYSGGQIKVSGMLLSNEFKQHIEQHMEGRSGLSPKSYNLTVEDINRRQTTPMGVNGQPSAMIENFSKDNYEYLDGRLGGHNRPPVIEESDEERRRSIRNMDGRVSGKTTAKGGPMSNDEAYEEDEDGEMNYKGQRDEMMEDSQAALNNGDLSGVEMKARPQTAKVKNEDENVFYRR